MTKTIQIATIIAITSILSVLALTSQLNSSPEAFGQIRGLDNLRPSQDEGFDFNCVFSNLPEDPIEVDVTPTVNGFRSIIIEKEVWDCLITEVDTGNVFPTIIQTTIVIQQTENKKGIPKGPLEIEVSECFKDLEFTEFGPFCVTYDIGDTLNELDCSENISPPTFVDMASASFDWFHNFDKNKVTTKSVIVEKEILDCVIFGTTTPVIVDVFIIEEYVNGNLQPFKWVICEKNEVTAFVIACQTSVQIDI